MAVPIRKHPARIRTMAETSGRMWGLRGAGLAVAGAGGGERPGRAPDAVPASPPEPGVGLRAWAGAPGGDPESSVSTAQNIKKTRHDPAILPKNLVFLVRCMIRGPTRPLLCKSLLDLTPKNVRFSPGGGCHTGGKAEPTGASRFQGDQKLRSCSTSFLSRSMT